MSHVQRKMIGCFDWLFAAHERKNVSTHAVPYCCAWELFIPAWHTLFLSVIKKDYLFIPAHTLHVRAQLEQHGILHPDRADADVPGFIGCRRVALPR